MTCLSSCGWFWISKIVLNTFPQSWDASKHSGHVLFSFWENRFPKIFRLPKFALTPTRPENVPKMITFWHCFRSSTRLGDHWHLSEWYRALFRTYLRRQHELRELSTHRYHPSKLFQPIGPSQASLAVAKCPRKKKCSFFWRMSENR